MSYTKLEKKKAHREWSCIYKTKELLFVYLSKCQEVYALPVQTEMLMKVH